MISARRLAEAFLAVIAFILYPAHLWAVSFPEWPAGVLALQPRGDSAVTAFVHVAVIPMDSERVLTDQTVLVQGGHIVALAAASQVKVPPHATIIDGQGKVLLPGLTDMHAHLQWWDSATVERALTLFVATGVTTIRNMDYFSSPLFSDGQQATYLNGADLLRLRARIAAGALLGPRLYTAGPWSRHSMENSSIMDAMMGGPEESQEEVEQDIAAFKKAGFDFIKVHDEGATTYEYLAKAAHKVGIPFAGHVPGDVSLQQALDAGQKSIEHLTGYRDQLADSAHFPALVAATVKAGAWNCPTLLIDAVNDGAIPQSERAQWPEERYFLPAAQQRHASNGQAAAPRAQQGSGTDAAAEIPAQLVLERKLVKALQDGGAGLLLGTDAPARSFIPGFSVHRELQALVDAGLTPYQALLTGTRNVASYFGTTAESGTVAVGKRADLLLLDANPLTDIKNTTHIAGVMLGTRWFSRATLDSLLASSVGSIDDMFLNK